MSSRIAKLAVAMALAVVAWTSHAEDIDLFVGAPTSGTDLPNVLFIVDNTANWNTAFSNEMSALANTFQNLPVNSDGSAKFNVGIMFSTETGSPNNNVKGGYVRAAMRPMTTQNKTLYANLISSLNKLSDKGDGGYSAITMAEAYYYFSSGTPYAGNSKVKADYTGNTSGTSQSKAIYALGSNALSAIAATKYTAPTQSGCTRNYIIYVSNGPNQENNSTDTLANTFLTNAGGSSTQIAISPSGSASNPSDEWARFMRQNSLGVVTYTIDVDPATNGQGPGWTALLKSMSNVSDGKYAAVSSSTGSGQQISDAINKDLSEIQAVNSVFASVSLPLSVNTQGTYLNQVYVGMFRPDSDGFPRWEGNLKQYKLGFIGADLKLEDATGAAAINSLTGFITECALSFWTPSTTDSYWSFYPQGACIPPSNLAAGTYKNSNSPDGNIVEKGAEAYVLRNTSVSATTVSRTLKTCSPTFSSCTSLTDFNTSNSAITQTLLGAASSAEHDTLINWERGLDLSDENGNLITSEMRPSSHGDVVHSRPVALNFGTASAPAVVVFYGGNDGVFRAINGNRTGNISSIPPGGELWGFIPPEFYGNIKRLHDDNVQISFPNITTGSPLPKPYAIDGAIAAYKDSSNAWIFAAMRRGGRALYSFNVNVSDPTNVSLKWKVGCPSNFPTTGTVSDTGCTSGWSGIGQTWSSPKAFKTAASSTSPLLIMGGGYDTCEDANPNTCTSSSKGNKVYVFDTDGNLLNTFSTDRAVIADVAIVPDLTTGLAVYAYVVDLGGNIYRITIGTNTAANWTMTKIASLGCSTAATCTYNRKFMFAPDVALDSGTYVLLVGSGDREKPQNYTDPVSNYFFMVRDKPADNTWLSSESTNCGSAILCLNSLLQISGSSNPAPADLAVKKGWYLVLHSTEQVVTGALTIYGNVTFSTHQPVQPAAGVCASNLGTARVYNILFSNAASDNGTPDRSQVLPSNIGLPPSPVGGLVTLDDNRTVPFCIGCSPDSPLEGDEPKAPTTSVPTQPKGRVYWYIER